MKKGSILILFLLLTVGFTLSNETVSKAKKLEKKEPRTLYVQQGKIYKLSKILADMKDPDEGISLKKCLKGKTVKWSVNKKQIKLTKNTIKVKKKGEFKLTGRTKKYKYIITLKSVPEKWQAIPEGITSASIRKVETTVKVEDIDKVKYLCSLFNTADYRFDYNLTNWTPVGWSYWIILYNADGTVEREFIIGGESLSMGVRYRKKKNIDIYNYVTALYQSLLAGQTPDGVAP